MQLVLLRHGQSEFNQSNQFAGWVDTILTPHGVAQAEHAGILLAASAFSPDVVFSSTLSRAVDTAAIILAKLGLFDLEIEQREALLERHYGGLTGMNKDEARNQFGEEKFKQFRRSYDVAPPPIAASNPHHPEHAAHAPKVIGIPPQGSESLAHVVTRVKPFWEGELREEIQSGKKILISAHGNSLRALVMLMEGLSPQQVEVFELENAAPIGYRFAKDAQGHLRGEKVKIS